MISPEDDFITRPMGFGLNENEANCGYVVTEGRLSKRRRNPFFQVARRTHPRLCDGSSRDPQASRVSP